MLKNTAVAIYYRRMQTGSASKGKKNQDSTAMMDYLKSQLSTFIDSITKLVPEHCRLDEIDVPALQRYTNSAQQVCVNIRSLE